MDLTIGKWGNSLGVRIPAAVARAAGLGLGMPVHITAAKGRVIVEPVRYDLHMLVRGITPENRHAEIDTGAPRGDEIW